MKGSVYAFNGIYGICRAEDGNSYFIHKSALHDPARSASSVKNCLSKARTSRPVEIEFTPGGRTPGEQRPRALNVRIIKPAGFVPEHTKNGYWLPANKGDNEVRCSSCGHTAPYAYKFCPHCGVRMDRKKPTEVCK